MSWEPPFSLGPGSAELTEGRRFLRMLQRHAKLLLAGGSLLVVAILFLFSLVDRPSSTIPPSSYNREEQAPVTPSADLATESPYKSEVVGQGHEPTLGTPLTDEGVHQQQTLGGQIYAISLAELPGLPPDAAPGTLIDLWATWEPPVTRRPKVQLLIEGVTLEGISAPFTPDGPFVANLLVAKKDLPNLVYGDRFGKLNASLQPSR